MKVFSANRNIFLPENQAYMKSFLPNTFFNIKQGTRHTNKEEVHKGYMVIIVEIDLYYRNPGNSFHSHGGL